jgi:hypothetical protein
MADAFSTGWAIFRKSITQIIYNLPDAFKISGPLWILIYLASIFTGQAFSTDAGVTKLNPGSALLTLLATLLIICGFCWVAILWHRFMLLNEGSDNLVAKWNGSRIWSYFKYLFFIGLAVLVIAAIPYSIIIFMLSDVLINNPVVGLLFGIIVSVIFYYLSLRFGLVLPSVALDKPVTLGDSFSETESCKGAILVASVLLVGLSIVVGQLIQISGVNQYTFQLPSFLTNWFFTMTGISILTTLYGFLIEKRGLT